LLGLQTQAWFQQYSAIQQNQLMTAIGGVIGNAVNKGVNNLIGGSGGSSAPGDTGGSGISDNSVFNPDTSGMFDNTSSEDVVPGSNT